MTKTLTSAPLYVQLEERIKSEIASGKLQRGLKLPSILALARQFKVSDITVRKAVANLCSAGLVESRQGHGTFVAAPGAKKGRSNTVVLLVRSHGHLYGTMAMALVGELQRRQYRSVILDTLADRIGPAIEEAFKERPAAVVLEGYFEFPPEFLAPGGAQPDIMTVMLWDESSRPFKGDRVLSDDFHGGQLVARHLLEIGCRTPLFICPHRRAWEADSASNRALAGFKQELAAAGRGWNEDSLFVCGGERERDEAGLLERFRSAARPDAVFCFGDTHVKDVYGAARMAGLGIPDDLAVVGYFNTPWCEMLEVPLSSVCIKEVEIARATVERTLDRIERPGRADEVVMVKPELVVRESSRRKA